MHSYSSLFTVKYHTTFWKQKDKGNHASRDNKLLAKFVREAIHYLQPHPTLPNHLHSLLSLTATITIRTTIINTQSSPLSFSFHHHQSSASSLLSTLHIKQVSSSSSHGYYGILFQDSFLHQDVCSKLQTLSLFLIKVYFLHKNLAKIKDKALL